MTVKCMRITQMRSARSTNVRHHSARLIATNPARAMHAPTPFDLFGIKKICLVIATNVGYDLGTGHDCGASNPVNIDSGVVTVLMMQREAVP